MVWLERDGAWPLGWMLEDEGIVVTGDTEQATLDELAREKERIASQ